MDGIFDRNKPTTPAPGEEGLDPITGLPIDYIKKSSQSNAFDITIDETASDPISELDASRFGRYGVTKPWGTSQSDFLADLQPNWKAILNGTVQAVGDAAADIISSPAHFASLFKDIGQLDEGFMGGFFRAGEWLKEKTDFLAPVERSKKAQNAIFNPLDGEWIAGTIEQFGATVGLMAASMFTAGALTPGALRILGRMSKVSSSLNKAFRAGIKAGDIQNVVSSSISAITSRTVESSMEAYEVYEATKNKLISEGIDPTQAAQMAESEARGVYRKNLALIGLDYLQFKGLTDGFGLFKKVGGDSLWKSLGKKGTILGIEAGSEAFEEGAQSMFGKYAEESALADVGLKEERSFGEAMWDYMEDRDLKQAMVQGALGGAVFNAIGSFAENYKSAYVTSKLNDQYLFGREMDNIAAETLVNAMINDKTDVLNEALEKGTTDENNTEEAQKYSANLLDATARLKVLKEDLEKRDDYTDSAAKAKLKAEATEILTRNRLSQADTTLKNKIAENIDNQEAVELAALELELKAVKNIENKEARKAKTEQLKSKIKELKDTGIKYKLKNADSLASDVKTKVISEQAYNQAVSENLDYTGFLNEETSPEAVAKKKAEINEFFSKEENRSLAAINNQLAENKHNPDIVKHLDRIKQRFINQAQEGAYPVTKSRFEESINERYKNQNLKDVEFEELGVNSINELLEEYDNDPNFKKRVDALYNIEDDVQNEVKWEDIGLPTKSTPEKQIEKIKKYVKDNFGITITDIYTYDDYGQVIELEDGSQRVIDLFTYTTGGNELYLEMSKDDFDAMFEEDPMLDEDDSTDDKPPKQDPPNKDEGPTDNEDPKDEDKDIKPSLPIQIRFPYTVNNEIIHYKRTADGKILIQGIEGGLDAIPSELREKLNLSEVPTKDWQQLTYGTNNALVTGQEIGIEPKVDSELVNNFDKYEGEAIVYFEANKNTNQELDARYHTAEGIRIDSIVYTKDGKFVKRGTEGAQRRVLGMLQAVSEYRLPWAQPGSPFHKFRESFYREYNAFYKTNPPTENFVFSATTKVKSAIKPHLKVVPYSKGITVQSHVNNGYEPYITMFDGEGNWIIKDGHGAPPDNRVNKKDEKKILSQYQSGRPVLWFKGPDGMYYPRIGAAVKLKDAPEIMEAVAKILSKIKREGWDNVKADEISRELRTLVAWKENGKPKPEFGGNFWERGSWQTPDGNFDVAGYINKYLAEHVINISIKDINRGQYNERIAKYINLDIDHQSPFQGTSFLLEDMKIDVNESKPAKSEDILKDTTDASTASGTKKSVKKPNFQSPVTQAELEQYVKDIEAQIKSLRGKDGVVPKEKSSEFKKLKKELIEAQYMARRGNLFPGEGVSIKNTKGDVLTDEKAEDAEQLIEEIIKKSIETGKSVESVLSLISKSGYQFDYGAKQALNEYIRDRLNPNIPEVGNNKAPFPLWRRGLSTGEEWILKGGTPIDSQKREGRIIYNKLTPDTLTAMTVEELNAVKKEIQTLMYETKQEGLGSAFGTSAEYQNVLQKYTSDLVKVEEELIRREKFYKGETSKTVDLTKQVTEIAQKINDILSTSDAIFGYTFEIADVGNDLIFVPQATIALKNIYEKLKLDQKTGRVKAIRISKMTGLATIEIERNGKITELQVDALKQNPILTKKNPFGDVKEYKGNTGDDVKRFKRKNNSSVQPLSAKEKKWFKKRFPNVPLEVFDNLHRIFGTDAWGAWNAGTVYVAKIGPKGIIYHEAFHGVFGAYLTEKEQDVLYHEAFKKWGAELGITEEEFLNALKTEQRNFRKLKRESLINGRYNAYNSIHKNKKQKKDLEKHNIQYEGKAAFYEMDKETTKRFDNYIAKSAKGGKYPGETKNGFVIKNEPREQIVYRVEDGVGYLYVNELSPVEDQDGIVTLQPTNQFRVPAAIIPYGSSDIYRQNLKNNMPVVLPFTEEFRKRMFKTKHISGKKAGSFILHQLRDEYNKLLATILESYNVPFLNHAEARTLLIEKLNELELGRREFFRKYQLQDRATIRQYYAELLEDNGKSKKEINDFIAVLDSVPDNMFKYITFNSIFNTESGVTTNGFLRHKHLSVLAAYSSTASAGLLRDMTEKSGGYAINVTLRMMLDNNDVTQEQIDKLNEKLKLEYKALYIDHLNRMHDIPNMSPMQKQEAAAKAASKDLKKVKIAVRFFESINKRNIFQKTFAAAQNEINDYLNNSPRSYAQVLLTALKHTELNNAVNIYTEVITDPNEEYNIAYVLAHEIGHSFDFYMTRSNPNLRQRIQTLLGIIKEDPEFQNYLEEGVAARQYNKNNTTEIFADLHAALMLKALGITKIDPRIDPLLDFLNANEGRINFLFNQTYKEGREQEEKYYEQLNRLEHPETFWQKLKKFVRDIAQAINKALGFKLFTEEQTLNPEYTSFTAELNKFYDSLSVTKFEALDTEAHNLADRIFLDTEMIGLEDDHFLATTTIDTLKYPDAELTPDAVKTNLVIPTEKTFPRIDTVEQSFNSAFESLFGQKPNEEKTLLPAYEDGAYFLVPKDPNGFEYVRVPKNDVLYPESKLKREGMEVLESLEEKMSDTFQDFTIVHESDNIGDKLNAGFKKLWYRIRKFFNKASELEKLFYKIQYNTEPFELGTSFDNLVRFSRKESPLSPAEEDMVANIGLQLLDKVIMDNPDHFEGLSMQEQYRKALNNDPELNYIVSKGTVPSVLQVIAKRYRELSEEGAMDPKTEDLYNRTAMALTDDTGQKFGVLYARIVEKLSSRGIKVKFTGEEIEANEEITEGDVKEAWAIANMEMQPMDKISDRLRRVLYNIPVSHYVQDGSTETKEQYNILNFVDKHDYFNLFRKVRRIIGNSYNSDHMMQKLETEAKNDPAIAYVLDIINNSPGIKTEFFSVAQQYKTRGVDIGRGEKGYISYYSNASRKIKVIMNEWKSGFYLTKKNTKRIQKALDNLKAAVTRINPDGGTQLKRRLTVVKSTYDVVARGKMVMEFKGEQRADVTSNTTAEAIRKGERTATTRYGKQAEYWSKFKEGDVVEFKDSVGDPLYVRITRAARPLTEITAEEWSKKEGWKKERFENKTQQQKENGIQFEFEYLGDTNKTEREGFQDLDATFQLRQLFFELGINLPDINNLKTSGKLSALLDSHIYPIAEALIENPNTDIFVSKIPNRASLIEEVAKAITHDYPEVQDSHIKPGGGQVFEWTDRNFITDMLMLLDYDKTAFKEQYKGDPLYENHPMLEKLLSMGKAPVYGYVNQIKNRRFGEGTEYQHMTDRDFIVTALTLFRSGRYLVPLYADSPVLGFIELGKHAQYSGTTLEHVPNSALENIVELLRNEHERYGKTKFTQGANPKQYSLLPIERKDRFNKEDVTAEVEKYLNNLTNEFIASTEKYKLRDEYDSRKNPDGSISYDFDVLAKQFIYENTFAQMSMISLMHGDMAYYGGSFDFNKRAKQIHSPGLFLDLGATFNEKPINPQYKVYVDVNEDTNVAPQIEEIIDMLANSGKYKKEDIARIRAMYEDADASDGQSFIDPIRYKEIHVGLQRWDDQSEATLDKVLKGKELTEDDIIFGTLKPHYYGLHNINGEVVPIQQKDSEAVLTPDMAKYGKKYKDILEGFGYVYNEDGSYSHHDPSKRKYDKYAYKSTIKVGKNIFDEAKGGNPIQTFENKYYKYQQDVPQKFENADIKIGTQIIKLISAGINDSQDITIMGTTKSAYSWKRDLNKALIEKTNDQLKKLDKYEFEDIIEKLREEVIARDLGADVLAALDIIDDGYSKKTAIPLFAPVLRRKLEPVIYSLYQKVTTKVKMSNGFAGPNVTGFLFDDKPKIKFKEDGSIDYMEVYMPLHDPNLAKFVNKDGTIKKGHESKFEAILYRIPTEGKFSMFPVRVTKILPRNTGGNVIFPLEITTIAGLDFDIDKMFGFFRDTKADALDRDIFEIMWGLLRTKDSTTEMFNPGNFKRIEDDTKFIRKRKAMSLESTAASFLSMVQTFRNMMAGKHLIGVAANWSASAAIWEMYDLKLNDNLYFYGDTRDDPKRNLSQNIGRGISEYLTAVVDNGKNPQAAYMNLNLFTANTHFAMIKVGVDPTYVRYFMSQPVLVELEKYYQELGGDQNALNQIKEMLQLQQGYEFNPSHFTREELITNMTMTSRKPMSFEELIQNPKDFAIAKTFVQYRDVAQKVANAIGVTKLGDAGVGPSFGQTAAKVKRMQDASESFTVVTTIPTQKGTMDIPGIGDILHDSDSYASHLLGLMYQQADFINNKIMQGPSNDNNFSKTVDKLSESMFVNAKTLDLIYDELLLYLTSDFFDRQSIEGLEQRLIDYKQNNPDTRFYDFTSRLTVEKGDIIFNSATGNSKIEEARLRDLWNEMIKTGTEVETQLAIDLVAYAYFKYGYTYSLKGFGHLQPIDFYQTLGLTKSVENLMNFVNHSGGAEGSDSIWEDIGKEFGLETNNHYYVKGTKFKPKRGNFPISKDDYKEGRKEAAKAAKRNWGYSYSAMKDDRLIRNWAQVKYSDAVFAIGHIVGTGEPMFPHLKGDTRTSIAPAVQGGTGYAVGMAINHNKPVYVFNQTKGTYDVGWYMYEDGDFVPIDTPALTEHFAGIGTRYPNEAGKQAIRDAYEATIAQEAIQISFADHLYSKMKEFDYSTDAYFEEQFVINNHNKLALSQIKLNNRKFATYKGFPVVIGLTEYERNQIANNKSISKYVKYEQRLYKLNWQNNYEIVPVDKNEKFKLYTYKTGLPRELNLTVEASKEMYEVIDNFRDTVKPEDNICNG